MLLKGKDAEDWIRGMRGLPATSPPPMEKVEEKVEEPEEQAQPEPKVDEADKTVQLEAYRTNMVARDPLTGSVALQGGFSVSVSEDGIRIGPSDADIGTQEHSQPVAVWLRKQGNAKGVLIVVSTMAESEFPTPKEEQLGEAKQQQAVEETQQESAAADTAEGATSE
jgi:hypothetical protein